MRVPAYVRVRKLKVAEDFVFKVVMYLKQFLKLDKGYLIVSYARL